MDAASAPSRIALFLEEIGVDADRRGERAWTVAVPSAKRGSVAVLIVVGERTLTLRAFIMRAPDRDHRGVYERLLGKNLTTRHWRFGIDSDGDVHVVADAPLAGLDAETLDGLLGSLSALVDETYESIVRMGFDVPAGTAFGPPPAGG
jgi:hypothetical protein